MKQPSNSTFESAVNESLTRARKFNDMPRIIEAINRASMLIALSPEKAEEIFKEKMQKG